MRDNQAELCRKKIKNITELLSDLSTPEKIDNVVTAAIKEPFENSCGELHYKVLTIFNKYKIFNKKYTTFLNNTLRD